MGDAMKMLSRQRSAVVLPGVVARVRADRRVQHLVPRLQPGDAAVIDQSDLDRGTAQALVDRGVAVVLNRAPMLSGRYPALGPDVLVQAGVPVVDGVGDARLEEGATVRVHEAEVHAPGEAGGLLAAGRVVDRETLDADLASARDGMASQLESFTHNSTEFLRREQDLLLHGVGLPRLKTRLAGRPVVVVVPGRDHDAELARVRRFAREQDPVVIGVGRGADAARKAGLRPDVVVVDSGVDDADLPDAVTVRRAADLVVVVARGSNATGIERFERLGLRPLRVESAATAEDTALLLADTGASVVIGVGMHATLDEFLDRRRGGLASTYLTRLKVGERLVDASTLPTLYSGRVRPRHLVGVGLAGLVALGAAIGVTPVGQEWVSDLAAWVPSVSSATVSTIEGLL